jgi:hypothetical protein
VKTDVLAHEISVGEALVKGACPVCGVGSHWWDTKTCG